jgi:hypothetical protein
VLVDVHARPKHIQAQRTFLAESFDSEALSLPASWSRAKPPQPKHRYGIALIPHDAVRRDQIGNPPQPDLQTC